jgi:integrase
VRHDLNVLGHLFKVAVREWDIPITGNPVDGISKPKLPHSRTRRLDNGEQQLLEAAAEAQGGSMARDVIAFAIETALRRSELLALKHQHIDFRKRILVVPEAKNGHPRTIPLTPKAIEILTRRSDEGERPFPVSVTWLRYVWSRVVLRAKSTDLHFHDLRHEAISRFFEKGLSVAEVALISGHRDVRQLFRYTHLRAEDIAQKLA